jgi:hypothetical protein
VVGERSRRAKAERLFGISTPQLLQLTRLQALTLSNARISDEGLQQLTALRRLTRLGVYSHKLSKSMRAAAIRSGGWVSLREVRRTRLVVRDHCALLPAATRWCLGLSLALRCVAATGASHLYCSPVTPSRYLC